MTGPRIKVVSFSLLACEANVDEDELLNLIDSSMYCLFCQFPNLGYLWTL